MINSAIHPARSRVQQVPGFQSIVVRAVDNSGVSIPSPQLNRQITNSIIRPLLLMALLTWTAILNLDAAVPESFTYQGRVDVAGTPHSGEGQFKFSLINPADSAAVWSNDGSHLDGTEPDTFVSLGVTNGLFTIALGDTNLTSPFAAGLFETYGNLALRIWFNDGVNGFTQLTPDQRLTAAPYALAANISPGSLTGDQLAPGGVDYTRLTIGGLPEPGQVLGFDGLGFSWQTAGGGGGSTPWLTNGTNIFYNAGFAGLGTATPRAPLEIWGNWDAGEVANLNLRGAKPTLSWETSYPTTGLPRTYSWILHEGPDGPGNLSFYTRNHSIITTPGPWQQVMSLRPDRSLSFGASTRQMIHLWDTTYGIGVQDFVLYQRTGGAFAWYRGGTHNNNALNPGAGGVPMMTLEDFTANLYVADFKMGHPTRRGAPGRALVDSGTELIINFGDDWNVTRIGGSKVSVKVLEITGGADLAEPFQMSEGKLAPGSVVVIDEDNPGHLKLAAQAYDQRVAGIISGANGVNPGIALQQQGVLEGGQNVALTGRVYVRADADAGVIKPGDLLTTSDRPGHAMRVTEPGRAQGAILGKAMTGLKSGQGLVLVLVTLQ